MPWDAPVTMATFCCVLMMCIHFIRHGERRGALRSILIGTQWWERKAEIGIPVTRQTVFRAAMECGRGGRHHGPMDAQREEGIVDRIDAMKVFVAALDEGSL